MSIQTLDELLYLRLSPKEQEIFEDANLEIGHAKILLNIISEKNRIKLLNYIVKKHLNVGQAQKVYNKHFLTGEHKQSIEVLPKDIRLFINTFDSTVSRMKSTGLSVLSEKSESENYFEYVIKIQKP